MKTSGPTPLTCTDYGILKVECLCIDSSDTKQSRLGKFMIGPLVHAALQVAALVEIAIATSFLLIAKSLDFSIPKKFGWFHQEFFLPIERYWRNTVNVVHIPTNRLWDYFSGVHIDGYQPSHNFKDVQQECKEFEKTHEEPGQSPENLKPSSDELGKTTDLEGRINRLYCQLYCQSSLIFITVITLLASESSSYFNLYKTIS